jgi:glycosyltransferase involved in cell wall biosynthesis
MRFTIVTPSYNQLDWLRLCVASVRDQVANSATQGAWSMEHGANRGDACGVLTGGKTERDETGNLKAEGIRNKIFIEHIVQDAGTEGIEEFAREMGAAFHRDGKEVFSSQSSVGSDSKAGYSLTIYSEKDAGMYDAINKGLKKASGDICAYLNCDEQYLPGTLQWVADYFSVAPGTDVLFGAAIVTRADGSYVCDRRIMVPTRWHTMVSGNLSIFTSSTFFRRTSVVERGLFFDPQWRVCGDAVWALRFLEAGLRMESTHKPLSAFAETGVNMSAVGNPRAAEESRRLALSAPSAARALKPAVLLDYRLRRWWSGAYALKPHQYSIFTLLDTKQRHRFNVDQPAFRWQMGSEQG